MSRTKGTQHQDTSGRGCAWYAAQSRYDARDCGGWYTGAGRLIEGLTAEHLIADKGYDSKAIIEQAGSQV